MRRGGQFSLEFSREQHEELLRIVDEECDRIDQLVGKAQKTAQVQPEEMKLAAAPHSVDELISTVLAGCQDAIRQRRIHFEVSGEDSQILVDLHLAGTALGHLIQNANLYSAPGQPMTLSAEKTGSFSFSERVGSRAMDRGRGEGPHL